MRAKPSRISGKSPSPDRSTTRPKLSVSTPGPLPHPLTIIQRAQSDPSSLTRSDVLQLQRTIGNQAVLKLLHNIPRHPVQRYTGTGVIQATKHPVETVIDALKNIEFGGTDFEAKIKLNSDLRSEQDVTLQNIVRARLNRLYDKREDFEDDDEYTALQISYVTDVVAEYIAKSTHVNIPRMKDRISSLLLKHFGQEITGSFDENALGQSLALAEKVAGDDPVALYIKKMIPLDTAAQKINQIAIAAEKEPARILVMYIQRFKDRVMGFTGEQVTTGQESELYAGKADFPVKELVGNLSTAFRDYVRESETAFQITDTYGWSDGIENRFQELEDALDPEDPLAVDQPLVPPYVEALRSILPEEEKAEAQELWDFMVTQINREPILIIFSYEHLKGIEESSEEEHPTLDYQSMIEFMLQDKSVSSLIKPETVSEETVPSLHSFDVAKDLPTIGSTLTPREKTYGPWREEKDIRAAQQELTKGNLPTFGYVPYYPYETFGANVGTYYGDTVARLKNAKKGNAQYKWTDQGKLHGTAGEALQDLALKDKHQLIAAATYLIHDNMTMIPSTKLEAIVPGGVAIPADIEEFIASKNAEAESLFGKEITKSADYDVQSVDWFMASETMQNYLMPQDKDATSAEEIFALSQKAVVIRNRILRQLIIYDDSTSEETGWWTKSPNPDKQRITDVRQALRGNRDFRTWGPLLKQFIDNATPGWWPTPAFALKELRTLYDQLIHLSTEEAELKDQILARNQ